MKYPSPRQYAGITAASLLVFFMLGCSSVGLAPAQNMEQRIAYAYATNFGLRNSAATALNGGRIEAKEAGAALEITNQARTLLDAARMANGVGDTKTAEARLVLALSVLQALQNRLNEVPKVAP